MDISQTGYIVQHDIKCEITHFPLLFLLFSDIPYSVSHYRTVYTIANITTQKINERREKKIVAIYALWEHKIQ